MRQNRYILHYRKRERGKTLCPALFSLFDGPISIHPSGIFAVGNLCEKYARQIVLSVADGYTAALAAAHFVEFLKTGRKKSLVIVKNLLYPYGILVRS